MGLVYKGGYLVKPKRSIIFFTETVTIPEAVFFQALRRSVSADTMEHRNLPVAGTRGRAQRIGILEGT